MGRHEGTKERRNMKGVVRGTGISPVRGALELPGNQSVTIFDTERTGEAHVPVLLRVPSSLRAFVSLKRVTMRHMSSFRFEHHLIDTSLTGIDWAQTAAADLDRDGRPEFILG